MIISFGNQREILSLSFFLFFFGLKIYVHVGRVKINFSQKIDTWDRFAFVREYRKMFDEFDEFFSTFLIFHFAAFFSTRCFSRFRDEIQGVFSLRTRTYYTDS